MPNFPTNIGHREPTNGATQNLRPDSNSATPETAITAVSSKSNKFVILTKKNSFTIHSKGIFEDLDISKFFAEVQYTYVKFDEKQDGAVLEQVGPPFSSYAKISSKNWGLVT